MSSPTSLIASTTLCFLLIASTQGAGCGGEERGAKGADTDQRPLRTAAKIVVVSRQQALAHYPCEQCHRHVEDGAGTVANAHASIRVDHIPNDDSCESCHYRESPGNLQLASGRVFDLEEVDVLCAQCHSPQVADWRLGIHGKQVGNWQRVVHRLGCTACHDPHQPAFGTMSSVSPPPFPPLGIAKGSH